MIIGIRHGEVHNPDHIIYAGLDGYGLSERGRSEATAAAQIAHSRSPVAIYSSPLQRALETAGAVAEVTGLEVVIDERLYEWKFWGRWAGIRWEELADRDPDTLSQYHRDPGALVGDESLAELMARVDGFLTEIRGRHDGAVVVVTHLEPLRAALCHRLGYASTRMGSIEIPTGGAVLLDPEPSIELLS